MKEGILCQCGKPFIAVIKNGKQISVTHTPEDEDWHIQYFSFDKIKERQKSN